MKCNIDIISIDSDRRRTLIWTPAAYAAWSKRPRKEMSPEVVDESLPQPFKAIRGASQGAVLSPTTWLAFFDILLVGLSHVKRNNILLTGLPGKLIFDMIQHTWTTYHTISDP